MNIIDIAVKRPVTVLMFTLAIVIFGMVSLSNLAVNLLPELSYPTLTIRTDYEGAAPGEVEQLVTKPIEEAIGVVKNVKSVESVSKAGQSDVILEFEWGTKMDLAGLEVREKLDVLQLPLDVEKPLLLRFNPSLDPIIKFGLGVETLTDEVTSTPVALDVNSMKRLRTYANEQIKRKLESVSGVASVQIGGGLENEVQVLIDQQKASQLNISIEDIIQRLQQENVNTAGGRVEDGPQEFLVRTLNQFQSLDEMRNLFIANRNGRNIRLSDIALVQDAYKERDSITRFDGFEGIEIAIYKEGDANTVQVAENVARRLTRIRDDFPDGYVMKKVYDQSIFIGSAIEEVKSAGIIGGLLAMIILFFFLKNIWPTLIISVSIPVSIIATFNLMNGYDISLNIMSLGGIALAIGLLVDNSIVVLENIDRHKRTATSPLEAASKGAKEVSSAIFASTLTTMAVFFPLVFVEGIAGQLFSDQALTVTFALIASLFVALSIIPTMAAREKHKATPVPLGDENQAPKPAPTTLKGKVGAGVTWLPKLIVRIVFYYLPLLVVSILSAVVKVLSKGFSFIIKPFLWVFDKVYQVLETAYYKAIHRALKAPVLVLTAILLVSLGSLGLVNKLGVELIPSMSQGEFFIEMTQPTGSRLESSDAVLEQTALFAKTQPGVARTYSLAGTGSLLNASTAQGGDHWGKINVVMESDASLAQEEQVKSNIRQYLRQYPSVTAKFGKPELFSFSTPLEIELIGYDLATLQKYSNKLIELLSTSGRFVDVKSTLESGNPEMRINFDHAKLAQLGLTAPQVANLISAKVGGEVASKYTIDDRKVDILVRNQDQQRDSIDDISQMIVNPGATLPIPLNAVATIDIATGPSEITRVAQQRVAIVSANLAYGDLGEAVVHVKELLPELKLPLRIQARISGQSEEMEASFNSLKLALLLAVFLVYLVMASQFESLLHPFLILFTVPLACAGSIYGLVITGTNVSVVVFIGLIMLAGIVVNNAIVLVDRINQLRAAGIEKTQAILDAASSRLRPILMTTLTTVLGLLPMVLGAGDGAEIRAPMAITVIFGLLFATVLTLFLIPALYQLFDNKQFVDSAEQDQPITDEDMAYE